MTANPMVKWLSAIVAQIAEDEGLDLNQVNYRQIMAFVERPAEPKKTLQQLRDEAAANAAADRSPAPRWAKPQPPAADRKALGEGSPLPWAKTGRSAPENARLAHGKPRSPAPAPVATNDAAAGVRKTLGAGRSPGLLGMVEAKIERHENPIEIVGKRSRYESEQARFFELRGKVKLTKAELTELQSLNRKLK